jgi:hypothetical protein
VIKSSERKQKAILKTRIEKETEVSKLTILPRLLLPSVPCPLAEDSPSPEVLVSAIVVVILPANERGDDVEQWIRLEVERVHIPPPPGLLMGSDLQYHCHYAPK